jgi:outer membrane receptor protein involved in Fe transport
VEAEREVIKMDVSSTQTRAQAEDIANVPLVTDVTDFLNLTAGVQDMEIRGGGLDQLGFMVDGLEMMDNRSNRPVIAINLSSVKEVSVIKGGFNAEYGNIRSGLINVVTKEGSPTRYHGTVDFRITPAYQKHSGSSITSGDIYGYRPYVDEDVAMVGTRKGWEREEQDQNLYFDGWNKYASQNPGKTAEEWRDMFLWEHALEGSGELGQREAKYAHKPDQHSEVSLSGPVPIVGKLLGNMSFFASYRSEFEMFPIPRLYRSAFTEENSQLKLTSRISRSMKLNIDLLYGEVHTVNRNSEGEEPIDDDYFTSGNEMLDYLEGGGMQTAVEGGLPFDVYRRMAGLTFDHILSPKTYYSVRVSRISLTNRSSNWFIPERDTTTGSATGRYFGDEWVDERPWGKLRDVGNLWTIGDGAIHAAFGYGLEDSSEVTTYNVKFDFTSQVNKNNQVKAGVLLNVDQLATDMRFNIGKQNFKANLRKSEHRPVRLGAYVQNRLEFEGMVANLGLRLDYSNPNTKWFDLETYDDWFDKEYRDIFEDEAPRTSVEEKKVRLSPRFGVSHPIGEASKIFFNYGHFYSMPVSADMYRIGTTELAQGVTYLADPYIDPPRTVAYELGFERNLFNMYLVSMAGYYRDITSQTGETTYIAKDNQFEYTTPQNDHYEDIRGFELNIEKRFGRWMTGWVNYNYMVQTSGYFGREEVYEDSLVNEQLGLRDPKLERPLARPYARANINFMTPVEFGPKIAGIRLLGDWSMGWLVTWIAGDWISWDPEDPRSFEVEENLLQNIQTKAEWEVDLRISKTIRVGRTNMTLFADIVNVFNIKNLNMDSFDDEQDDYEKYMKSLKLPMYKDEQYDRWEGGDAQVGDVYEYMPDDPKYNTDSDDFIDMPNLDHLWYLNPRHAWFGLTFEF